MIVALIILAIIVIIGLIRVTLNPSNSFLDLIMDIFLIDWLVDILGWIFKMIVSLIDSDHDDW
jgi:hypothetical protein